MTTFVIQTPDRQTPAVGNAAVTFLQKAWRRHSYIVPSFAISLLICAWFVTWGDLNFFEKETFCGFYDAQARSILHGHLDVPPPAIGFEAFVFRGKSYGYFGIAPAILRMPLVALFRSMDGQWSRLIMLAGFFLNMLCAYRLVLWVRGPDAILTRADRTLNSLFILCAGIGSTNIFLVGRSYTYHEAIMLGGVFSLLFAVLLIKYLDAPSLPRLALLGVLAFMSFHSRPTAGAGALLALCVLATILVIRSLHGRLVRVPGLKRHGRAAYATKIFGFRAIDNPLSHAVLAIASIVVILGVYFGVNYAKFRTFDGVPVKYYSIYQLNPSRMKVTGGRQIHPENIPMGLACYFGFRGAEFKPDFPWIFLCRRPSMIGKPTLDIVEQYSSIPVSMPALGLLALLGCMQVVRGQSERERQMRLPILVLMIGGGIILMTVGITERYLHDLYPFLIAAGAVGVLRVSRGRTRSITPSLLYSGERIGVRGNAASCSISRVAPFDESPLTPALSPEYGEEGVNARMRAKLSVLMMLALISIVLNCTFSVEYQRIAVWGVARAKHDGFLHFRQTVQNLLHGRQIPADEE